MKRKQQKRLRRLIQQSEDEIQNIRTLPYYRLFSRWAEQEADIKVLELKINGYRQQIDNYTNKFSL